MGGASAIHLWEAVLGELQLLLPKSIFETWLRGTRGLEVSSETLTVGVSSPFVAECLESRLYSLVARTLERVSCRPLDPVFCVVSGPAKALPKKAKAGVQPPPGGPPRLPFGLPGLHPDHTFDTFIMGPPNELPLTAAKTVAQHPDVTFNPLFLHSAPGLGKTHLLHAIAAAAAGQNKRWIYVSADQFTHDFVTSIRHGRPEAFHLKYRQAEILLLDDIQFMAGKERSQEALFHLFNLLYDARVQMVIAGDRPPRSLASLDNRLRSRFEGGLIVGLYPPIFLTRVAIINAAAQRLGTPLPEEVVLALARRTTGSVRHLEGEINHLVALARLPRHSSAEQLLEAIASPSPQSPGPPPTSPEELLALVSRSFHLSATTAAGPSRTRQSTLARHISMYLLRTEFHYSFSHIGRLLGNRDHSSVLYACTKVEKALTHDATLNLTIERLRASLYSAHPPRA